MLNALAAATMQDNEIERSTQKHTDAQTEKKTVEVSYIIQTDKENPFGSCEDADANSLDSWDSTALTSIVQTKSKRNGACIQLKVGYIMMPYTRIERVARAQYNTANTPIQSSGTLCYSSSVYEFRSAQVTSRHNMASINCRRKTFKVLIMHTDRPGGSLKPSSPSLRTIIYSGTL